MSSRVSPAARVFLLLVFASPVAAGADSLVMTLDGCKDSRGRNVTSETDYRLETLATARIEAEQPVIRYNPQVLPQLKSKTRLFLYARECAHHALGHPLDDARPTAMERRADCWAVETLMRSELLKGEADVTDIRVDLVRSPQEWSQLPGPPRTFELEACYRSSLKLPRAIPASPNQPAWNACVRICAEHLLQCQRGCRGEGCSAGCDGRYGDCSTACEARSH